MTKKNKHGWHTNKPDLDNLVKSVKDAMTGVVWADDSLVCHEELIKLYVDASELPRLVAAVGPPDDFKEALTRLLGAS